MDEWMDGEIDEWMNGWIHYFQINYFINWRIQTQEDSMVHLGADNLIKCNTV